MPERTCERHPSYVCTSSARFTDPTSFGNSVSSPQGRGRKSKPSCGCCCTCNPGPYLSRERQMSAIPAARKTNYTANEAIQVLEGLEPVRKRPAMYIGGVDL